MHWHNLNEFFAMGGYAFYVWGSFGLTALIAIWEVSSLHYRRKKATQRIKQQIDIDSIN
jgi:heme exporter protein D